MAPADNERPPLPKFGDWDINDPASAEEFTIIFDKARDQKRTNSNGASGAKNTPKKDQKHNQQRRLLLGCFYSA